MKKDVEHIRKEIARRKQKKLPNMYRKNNHSSTYTAKHFVDDEEKHGYMPTLAKLSQSSKEDTWFSAFLLKSMIAAIIFLFFTISHQVDQAWLSKPKQWATTALTEEFPFATVNQWYQQQFGSPLAFISDNSVNTTEPATALPVNGTISESFQVNGQGILITANNPLNVYAMDEGTVIFAGNDRKTNKTIIVQHPDKSKSIYGNLSDIHVNQYQFIKANQEIGKFVPSEDEKELYFAVKKNNQYLDPVQVIRVDDAS
ncbi:Stage IV sporulation protein FA [Paraliobacillus sp. PM-2]|uniref:M23 family metallopeptidase n=1 Tax=Paraliobacillus sp. PM-2 TaxID=1462524 RepID=UPI00061C734C|nr:M23 family metallopeptidase [Paraliobacillus sp. PM-2]CQR48003.1 Stage IV sporulation protein FA [Paraliobacillus sp. PM-2]